MRKPPNCTLEFSRQSEESFFASIPERPGIFLLEMHAPEGLAPPQPYLARTADLRRAAERLLREPDADSKRLNLRSTAARMQYWLTASRFEQAWLLYWHARELFPGEHRKFLRLRTPPLLKINLRNSYPRCYVTRRLLPDGARYFGPFVSREAAESFSGELLDLFKIRRCQIRICRDPEFPGCIYSEMKMCLAPCFGGCTAEDYRVEVSRVEATLASRGNSLISLIEKERAEASQATDFERAALLHRKFEKISGVFRGLPELVREIQALDAIVIQRALESNMVALFVIIDARISAPFVLHFGELSSHPGSAEGILRRHLEGTSSNSKRAVQETMLDTNRSASEPELRESPVELLREREDHLAILSRWFYSKPREGEILFRDNGWPYHKILRACARVLASAETA